MTCMEQKNQVQRIVNVTINYLDQNRISGLRADYQRVILNLDDDISKKLENRLWKRDGKIQNNSTFMGPIPNTGILMYRLPDHYNGKDITLKLDNDKKHKINNHIIPVQLHAGFHEEHNNISDFTEYMIVKTYFEDDETPQIDIFSIPRCKAKFKDPKYGTAIIQFPKNENSVNSVWESVEFYYYVPDPKNENFMQSTSFSYLNLKSDAEVEFADSMFETRPKFGINQNMSQTKDTKDIKNSAEFEEIIDKILEYDRQYNKKLRKFMRNSPDN